MIMKLYLLDSVSTYAAVRLKVSFVAEGGMNAQLAMSMPLDIAISATWLRITYLNPKTIGIIHEKGSPNTTDGLAMARPFFPILKHRVSIVLPGITR